MWRAARRSGSVEAGTGLVRIAEGEPPSVGGGPHHSSCVAFLMPLGWADVWLPCLMFQFSWRCAAVHVSL